MNTATLIAIALILLAGPLYSGLRQLAAVIAARVPRVSLPSLAGIWSAKFSIEAWKVLAIVLVVLLTRGVSLPKLPDWKLPSWPVVVAPAKVDRVTYVYEKDLHAIPSAVEAALNKLNREQGIVATKFEQDTIDGSGETPEQYKTALAAAKESGLPSLAVQAGAKVIRVVKNPQTEQAVLEAAQ